MTNDKILEERKARLEKKLDERGINNYRINNLPYLNVEESAFTSAYEVGVRLIILYSCAYVAYNRNEIRNVEAWLREQRLWDYVSPSEKDLFEGNISDEEKIACFQWRIESAITLGWPVGLLDTLEPPISEAGELLIKRFQETIPRIGAPVQSFLNDLTLRDEGEIFEENILNELATTYFRDLIFNGKNDTSDIDRNVSFERHFALNWVRRFDEITEWDDTDTST